MQKQSPHFKLGFFFCFLDEENENKEILLLYINYF